MTPAPTSTRPPSGSSIPARRRLFIGLAPVVVVVAALAWWASQPLPPVEVGSGVVAAQEVARGASAELVALDESAFHAPLWIAPPAPPPPPPKVEAKPETPPPPLRLQILAIARDPEGDRALLYDPDTDRPTWVRAGQPLGPRTVERVTAGSVEIRDGKHLRTLALRETKGVDSPIERALRAAGGKP